MFTYSIYCNSLKHDKGTVNAFLPQYSEHLRKHQKTYTYQLSMKSY